MPPTTSRYTLSNRTWFTIGTLLTFAYLLQNWLELRWEWLLMLQRDERYQFITGLILGGLILWQWSLFLARLRSKWRDAKTLYQIHKILGSLSPLLFYIHSMKIGSGFLLYLSVLFLMNTVVGLFNREILHFKQRIFSQIWFFLHIFISMLIVVLLYLHFSVAVLYH